MQNPTKERRLVDVRRVPQAVANRCQEQPSNQASLLFISTYSPFWVLVMLMVMWSKGKPITLGHRHSGTGKNVDDFPRNRKHQFSAARFFQCHPHQLAASSKARCRLVPGPSCRYASQMVEICPGHVNRAWLRNMLMLCTITTL